MSTKIRRSGRRENGTACTLLATKNQEQVPQEEGGDKITQKKTAWEPPPVFTPDGYCLRLDYTPFVVQ